MKKKYYKETKGKARQMREAVEDLKVIWEKIKQKPPYDYYEVFK